MLAFTGSSATADRGELSADHTGRILSGHQHDLGQHRGRGGFAMGAADTERVGIMRGDLAENHAPLDRRNAAFPCGDEFGIVRHDGRRIDDQISAFDVFRLLSEGDRDAHRPYPRKGIGFVVVRAGDVVAFFVKNLRHRIHSAAADPDKVKVFFILQIHISHSFHGKMPG